MIRLLPVFVLLLQAAISVRTARVAIPVTVTDARGHQVSVLRQENFRVFEDGQPQPITVFHHGDTPVTLGLIVDRSQSMRRKSAALSNLRFSSSSRPSELERECLSAHRLTAVHSGAVSNVVTESTRIAARLG